MSLDAKSGTFWLGVGLSLCGSLSSATGLACQRLSHKRNNALPPEEQVRSSRQWLNLLGVFLLFVESLFDLTSFGFAPASILSCMGAMTLVFNMMLAPTLCGEIVSKRDVAVNGIVFAGTILSVWFGPHATPDYTLPELMSLFIERRFIVYAVILLSWIGCLLYAWWALQDLENPKGRFRKMSRLSRTRLLRFAYPALAGSIGGNTAVYAKASIELVKTTIKGTNQFIYVGTYFLIILMIVCVVAQLKFLNGGLKRYESLYVVPVYQVFWIGCGVLGALFYFNEVASISARDLGMFALGAIISVFGILLHSTRTAPQDPTVGPEDLESDMMDETDNKGSEADGDVSTENIGASTTPVVQVFDFMTNEYDAERRQMAPLSTRSMPQPSFHDESFDSDENGEIQEENFRSEPNLKVDFAAIPDNEQPTFESSDDSGISDNGQQRSTSFSARRRRLMTA
mmetsp:Transcript_39676/g.95848  ORF Transcript_39676/g.95848 Transcript_39676/m.95848 type:complete len:456 (-) Transcript_39676:173-1540(-)